MITKAALLFASLGLLGSALITGCGSGCGDAHRWAVKTGTDPGAGAVDLGDPRTSTIATLVALPVPASRPETTREAPFETQTYRLTDVQIVLAKRSDDQDFHLVVEDAAGHTLIAEIPEPDCVGDTSPWINRITAARSTALARLNPRTTPATMHVTASLVGIGFFDAVHGQDGVAPNGIELHPVLGICFGAGCALP